MARAITENFAEMYIEVETSGGPLPSGPITVLSVSNANPAVVLIDTSDTNKIANGNTVTIAGLTGDMTAGNGDQVVAGLNTTAGTFTIAVDLSAAAAPQSTGITATPVSTEPLVWSRPCGLTSRTVNRQHNMQTTEVPDCDDESLPAAVERAVQSSEMTIAGTGVWAAQSHGMMMDWWRSGKTKNIRVANVKAPSGTVQYEQGPAYLTQLNNTAERGQKVTAEINIEFDGIPDVVEAA